MVLQNSSPPNVVLGDKILIPKQLSGPNVASKLVPSDPIWKQDGYQKWSTSLILIPRDNLFSR